jgi:hypothetical protein
VSRLSHCWPKAKSQKPRAVYSEAAFGCWLLAVGQKRRRLIHLLAKSQELKAKSGLLGSRFWLLANSLLAKSQEPKANSG